MTVGPRAVSPRTTTTAALTALGSVIALVVVALLAEHDPEHGAAATTPLAWSLGVATLLAQCVVLLRPHRLAGAGLLAAAALPLPLALGAPGPQVSVTAIPVVVVVFQAGLSTSVAQLRWWGAGAAVLVATGQVVSTLGAGRSDVGAVLLESVAQALVVIGVPLLPATVVAAHRATRAAQQETIAALARERDAQVDAALARERSAMARELHDIAAHHLSGISLMASAVARQAPTDAQAARAGALQIREQSKAVLDDLRRLVGLLRSAGEDDDAVKSVATVAALVATATATGRAIDLEIRRRRPGVELGEGVSALGQLAAYRMVQESLTNAARHAPGAAVRVLVDDTSPTQLRVSVQNAAPTRAPDDGASSGGFGVLGMRERALLAGGSFEAGPTGDDGWEARMSLPRHQRATAQQGATP